MGCDMSSGSSGFSEPNILPTHAANLSGPPRSNFTRRDYWWWFFLFVSPRPCDTPSRTGNPALWIERGGFTSRHRRERRRERRERM